MHAFVRSAALSGVDAIEVMVEASIAGGLPGVHVVGLPDAAVREARERVRSALRAVRLTLPASRVVVNLAPADVRKEGPAFDLPIALALLAAQARIPQGRLAAVGVVGELGLDGSVRAVRGLLALALAVRASGKRSLVLPAEQVTEVSDVVGLQLVPVATLGEAIAWARGTAAGKVREPVSAERSRVVLPGRPEADARRGAAGGNGAPQAGEAPTSAFEGSSPDLADVRGHPVAKRALEVAAAGGHHLLLLGSPGSGKTMLARRLPGLLPDLAVDAALEVARLHSLAGLQRGALERRPPLREPHHTLSLPGLLGTPTSLGELSLAHLGLLFLDELPEFERRALEALREPLESGTLLLARARGRARLPARVQLVAAMNPCPCGHAGDALRSCRCLPGERMRYLNRVSGPLLDRFAIRVVMSAPPEPYSGRSSARGPPARGRSSSESSRVVARRVAAARERALERQGCLNALLGGERLGRHAALPPTARSLLDAARASGRLGERGVDEVTRVARSLADLAGRREISSEDAAEALAYRAEITS